MAMIHIKCHAQPVNTGFPAVLCGGRKEKNVRILKIKTKTGIKTVYNVIDWVGTQKQAIFTIDREKNCITNAV